MSCAFNVSTPSGQVTLPLFQVRWMKQLPSGAELMLADGRKIFSASESFSDLLTSFGKTFLDFSSLGATYAVNFDHVLEIRPNSLGKATVNMDKRGEKFDTDEDFSIIQAKVLSCGLTGPGGGDTVLSFAYDGEDLSLITDALSFTVPLGPGEITYPVSLGGEAPGAPLSAGLNALNAQVGNIDLVESPAGTFTFTNTDGSTVVFDGSPPAPLPVLTDMDTIEGDGTALDPVILGSQGATLDTQALFWDTSLGKFAPKNIVLGQGFTISVTPTEVQIGKQTQAELIATNGSERVRACFWGPPPVVAFISGEVTVGIPAECELASLNWQFRDTDHPVSCLIAFYGPGLKGNTSLLDFDPPSVQKVNGIYNPSGGPSLAIPFSVDLDNSPSVQVVKVGDNGGPFIQFRLQGTGQIQLSNYKFSLL